MQMYRCDTSGRSNEKKYRAEASSRYKSYTTPPLGEAWDGTAQEYLS
jgi:hypothetical protein